MNNANLFNGKFNKGSYAIAVYKQLMSGDWVTYKGIMDLLNPDESKMSISNMSHYSDLKKAFRDVRNAIIEKVGKNCIEEEGNLKNRRYRYVGGVENPLEEMVNAKTVEDLKQYWQFCQDSEGFFPTSWLDYYFEDAQDLLNLKPQKRKGKQVLCAGIDRKSTNVELLPVLYRAIVEKKVLSIDYKPSYVAVKTLTFHPQYLKEYNGRWHLFGLAEGEPFDFSFDAPLDRIVGRPRVIKDATWISAPEGYYESFFEDIVGVSHDINDKKKYDIRIRAHNQYIYNLMITKKIHHSQTVFSPFGDYADGKYGELIIQAELNNELIGAILQMGPGLEVISPQEVRCRFKQTIKEMVYLYEDTD